MNPGVYKSEEGRKTMEKLYRLHLNSDLAVGLKQQIIDTPYGKTFVIGKSESGKPPLVLLHGSVSNGASWLGVIPLYAQYFSIYCLDIPGEPGLSTTNRFPLKSDVPEKWLAGALDTLGLHKVFFLGMSLGGWFAMNFAVRYPERVSALSLISVGGIAKQKSGFLIKALFLLLLGKLGRDLLNRMIFHNVEIPEEILEYQHLAARHFRPVTEPLPLFTDEQLIRLTMPLQFFGGEYDALLDTKESVARLSVLLPHAEVSLLMDTGHAIVDKFEETKDFLARHIPLEP